MSGARINIPVETIRQAGEMYVRGTSLGDLSRLLGLSAGLLRDRLHYAGFRLSEEQVRQRQGTSHRPGNVYCGEASERKKARDAEAAWAALNIRFEDAPVGREPGRVFRPETVVPRVSVLGRLV